MNTATALRAAATDQVVRPKTIFDHLDNPRFHKGLSKVAGKFLTPDRMLSLCINAVKKTPKLMQCDPQSVLGAMMASAALQLEPNTVQQQAFLIPYKRRAQVNGKWVDVFDCQFQVGARGFVTLAYRSPQIKFLTADAIHDGDKWENEVGSQAFLRYAKNLRDRGALIGAFSYVRFDGGAEGSCVLPFDELMKIRSKSETFRTLTRAVASAEDEKASLKAKQQLEETPWVMWEDDMCAKSAIKKHAKQLPLASTDAMSIAAELDDRGDAGTLDMKAFADPDVAHAVVSDEAPMPAIERQQVEQFETAGEAFGATARQGEKVAAEQQQTASKAKPEATAAKKAAGGVKPKTDSPSAGAASGSYAQLAEAIQRAQDGDAAALELDAARGLPPEQYEELVALYQRTWKN